VQLLPLGEVKPIDGREPWRVKDPAAIIAASQSVGHPLPIDTGHQTQLALSNGQPAPAFAWIKAFEVRKDGIWGQVDWTGQAAEWLRNKNYRFLSPTFLFDKATRVITRIIGAALTNDPALPQLTALASRQPSEVPLDQTLKAFLEALGLKPDTNLETALASARVLVSDAAASLAIATAVRTELKLDATASADEIATAIATARTEGTVDPTKYVPIARLDEVQKDLATLKADQAKDRATAAAEQAVKDGKITPAQKDWAIGYATRDPQGFGEFVVKQPVIAGGEAIVKGAPKKGDELTADELAVCKTMGLTPEAFKKTRDANLEVNQ
jgi:phage I-like protein